MQEITMSIKFRLQWKYCKRRSLITVFFLRLRSVDICQEKTNLTQKVRFCLSSVAQVLGIYTVITQKILGKCRVFQL